MKEVEMTFDEEFIIEIKKKIKQLETPEPLMHSGVQLFFSFDLVNSTHFKEVALENWANAIVDIVNGICDEVVTVIPYAKVWRIIGDQVVFVVKIDNKESLRCIIDDIYTILYHKVMLIIKRCNISNEYAKNMLSVKAAAWIAYTQDKCDSKAYNISTKYQFPDKYTIYEYIGNDIDTGFRISEFTRRMHLCINYELAYILAQDKNYLCWLHIISYEQLKGVWDGRWYPIIWYHNEQITGNTFADSFKYYESFNDDLIKCCLYKDFRLKRLPFLNPNMFTDTQYALQTIKDDCECTRVDVIEEGLSNETGNNLVLCRDDYDEFHVAVICFDSSGENVFIVRNQKHNRWEFGCCESEYDSSLLNIAQNGYKKLYGIDVNIITDDTRSDSQPIPVAIYSIGKGPKIKKGIIFTGTFSGKFVPTDKYSEHKVLPLIDLDKFVTDNFSELVNDFKRSIEMAYEILKKVRDK